MLFKPFQLKHKSTQILMERAYQNNNEQQAHEQHQ
jgi:hypothetical protein